ncbi:Uncharacterised protein [Citrobacter koseri]|nr:Uncharacterised protein [Citrobacter koseri]
MYSTRICNIRKQEPHHFCTPVVPVGELKTQEMAIALRSMDAVEVQETAGLQGLQGLEVMVIRGSQ